MFKYRRKLSHLFAYNLPRLSKLYFQDIQFQRFNQKKKKKKKKKKIQIYTLYHGSEACNSQKYVCQA